LNDVQEIIMVMDRKKFLPVNCFPVAWMELPKFDGIGENFCINA
jgi:hypothetical protein